MKCSMFVIFVLFQIGIVRRINAQSRPLKRFYGMEPSSDLSHIDLKDPSNPSILFKDWIDDARRNGVSPFFITLATATKKGQVSSRTVAIREIFPDTTLVFTSQQCSNKIRDIEENPQVAATLLLTYTKDNKKIARQVNLIATVEKLSQTNGQKYFENQSIPAKIRSTICQNCGPTDWDDLKNKHDALLKEIIENKKVLEMPENFVTYKIIPYKMDFYYTDGANKIGDRILFKKSVDGTWDSVRLMP